MEEGVVLIMKDLENIYGSLYDMLNQNYTLINKKKNCRVALGAYSNPICQVADSFRCIVLVEESKLDLSDPPFLNRFEKQYLRFSDIIGEREKEIIHEIENWIENLAFMDNVHFRKEDIFPIYNQDMVASLVLKHTWNKRIDNIVSYAYQKENRKIWHGCLEDLLWVIKPEIVVQLQSAEGFISEEFSTSDFVRDFFALPVHEGIDVLFKYHLDTFGATENLLCIIFTNSNIHTKISEQTNEKLQIEKLGAFKSEKQLSSRIQQFWERDDMEILVIQCNAKDDEKHIMLTKLVVERHRDEYLLRRSSKKKHVYLVIHLDRTKRGPSLLSQLNFLSQWHLVMLDSIVKPPVSLPEFCKLTLLEAIEQKRPLSDCLKGELFWAFTRIKYGPESRNVSSLTNIIGTIEQSDDFLLILDKVIWSWIRLHQSSDQNRNWLKKVANDKTLLHTSMGLVDALEHHILNTIKRPLCKFIFKFELLGILDSYFKSSERESYLGDTFVSKRHKWLSLIQDESVFCVDDIPCESGPECYSCDSVDLELLMPFSRLLFDGIESTKENFLEVVKTYKVHCLLDEDDALPRIIYDEVLSQQESYIFRTLPTLKKFEYKEWELDYLEDFLSMATLRMCPSLKRSEKIKYAKLIMKQFCSVTVSFKDPFTFVSRLHTTFWVNQPYIIAEMSLVETGLAVVPAIGNHIEKILSDDSFSSKESDILKDISQPRFFESAIKLTEAESYKEDIDIYFFQPQDSAVSAMKHTFFNTNEERAEVTQTTECNTASENVLENSKTPYSALSGSDDNKRLNITSEISLHQLIDEPLNELKEGVAEDLVVEDVIGIDISFVQHQDCVVCERDHSFSRTNEETEEVIYQIDFNSDKENVLEGVSTPNNNSNDETETSDTAKAPSFVQRSVDMKAFDVNRKTVLSSESDAYKCSDLTLEISLNQLIDDPLFEVKEAEVVNSVVDEVAYFGEYCADDCDHEKEAGAPVQNTNTAVEALVEYLCHEMLPTEKSIKYHSSVKNWVNKVVNALSQAYRVSKTERNLFSMRICCELANELIIPYELDSALLTALGDLLYKGSDLDSREVFDAVCRIIAAANKTNGATDVCIRLMSSYFVLCISADQDANIIDFIFEFIRETDIPLKYFHYIKAPFLLYFSLSEMSVFTDFIDTGFKSIFGPTDQNISLKNIDGNEAFEEILITIDWHLKKLFETDQRLHPVIVMLTDIFQQFYDQDFCSEARLESASLHKENGTDALLPIRENSKELFYKCHNLLVNRLYGVQFVAAVGYLKSFICQAVGKKDIAMDTELGGTLTVFDFVISDENDIELNSSIGVFLLKTLARYKSLNNLKKLSDTVQNVMFVRKFEWDAQYLDSCFEKNPLCIHMSSGRHSEYKNAIHHTLGLDTAKSEIDQMLQNSKIESEACIGVFSFALREFYLQQYSEPLTDTKRTTADITCNSAIDNGVQNRRLIFLLKLCGRENFLFPELQLSEEISSGRFYQVSFCVSWISLCLSYLGQALDSSYGMKIILANFKDTHLLPGLCYLEVNEDFKITPNHFTRTCYADCKCSSRLFKYGIEALPKCVVCQTTISEWKSCDLEKDERRKHGKETLVYFKMSSFGGHLQPVTRHLLQAITAASLIGSLETGSSLQNISHVTGILEADVVIELWKSFENHWIILTELLNISDFHLMVLFNVVILQSNEILFSIESPKSEETLFSWEEKFEKTVCSILPTRYNQIKKCLRVNDQLHRFDHSCLEQQILEVDEVVEQHEDKSENLRCKSILPMFRMTSTASKMNLISELYPLRNEFPCLFEVVRSEAQLKLPIHALNILSWHVATVSTANYFMKKNDCLKMSVQDFIYYKKDADNVKSRNVHDRFDAFKTSWDFLKEYLGDSHLTTKMQRLHSGSKMSECLLQENPIIRDVLFKLISIQNSCLERIMKYGHRCSALKFLFRCPDVAVLPVVQLTNVTKDGLFSCSVEWDTLLRQESHCNLSYGSGNHVHYDFHSIEQAVAVSQLAGKSFISTNDSLPTIVFMDELHMNYSSLIKALQSIVCQKPLPQEIINSIKNKKDDDPRMANQLLTHVGIVMTLLKKTKGDPETPLVEYLDSWKTLLGRDFPRSLLPSPETSVKLCHIVALNELLEELCADIAKDGVQDEFRAALDTRLQGHIINLMKDERLITIVLKSLKRFILRCVLAKTVEPLQPLRRYMADDSFWPMGTLKEEHVFTGERKLSLAEVITDEFMVRHSYAFLVMVESELQKQRTENLKMTRFASTFNAKSKSSPVDMSAAKKKKATSFRKF